MGPGSYHNEKLLSSLKIQTKPTDLQNFGSSSLRFPKNENSIKTLGPGKYDLKVDYQAPVLFKITNIS